jgi:hypothetical protein
MCIALHTDGGTVRNHTDRVLHRPNKSDKKGLRKRTDLLRHKNEKKIAIQKYEPVHIAKRALENEFVKNEKKTPFKSTTNPLLRHKNEKKKSPFKSTNPFTLPNAHWKMNSSKMKKKNTIQKYDEPVKT